MRQFFIGMLFGILLAVISDAAFAQQASSSSKATIKSTPDAYAPTVNATAPCRIAVSGGVAMVGIGVSAGGSVEDDPCNLRETARILDAIGQREAAARVMCNDPRAAAALGESVCHSRSGSVAVAASTKQPACWQDEIIAERMGAPVCR